jgi:hypothetical protein
MTAINITAKKVSRKNVSGSFPFTIHSDGLTLHNNGTVNQIFAVDADHAVRMYEAILAVKTKLGTESEFEFK